MTGAQTPPTWRGALHNQAAAAARWGIAHGLPRSVLKLAALSGDPIARIVLEPGRVADITVCDELHRRGPVVRTPALRAVPGHAAVNAVLRSNRFGVGGVHRELPLPLRWLLERVTQDRARGPGDPPSMLAVDPPQHSRYRGLVSRAFTPRRVAALEDQVAETAARLLDSLEADAPSAGFDLVAWYASRLPMAVIGGLLGVRAADHQNLLRWSDAAVQLVEPGLTWRQHREAEGAMTTLTDWFTEHVRLLRTDPGDDLLSQLAGLGVEDALDDVELRAMGLLVLVAGLETTVSLIGNAVALFDRHPEQLETVRADVDLWTNAVDEVLRYDSPLQRTRRVAIEETIVEGVHVPRGQALIALLAVANRDPEVFAEPHTFDVTRHNAGEHLTFSSGIHYCLGAGLARLEARVALRMLYERFPRLRVAGIPHRRQTRVLRAYATLPVAVEASP
ncbi:cytochrome P450 [Streptomyces morookaense]|uniref:cytochrome P450 n=1 Tax=Streptomyces morookaense TaxID=1970 RepID=UPI0033F097A2